MRLNLREVVNDYRWLARKQIRLVSKCSLASIARKLWRSVSYTCKKGTQKRFSLLISYFFYLSSQFHIRVNKFCDFMKCRDNLLWKIKTVPRTFNDILLPKLFRPTLRKIVLVIEKNFEITSTINSNSERSEKFWLTECFFNLLFLEVSHI